MRPRVQGLLAATLLTLCVAPAAAQSEEAPVDEAQPSAEQTSAPADAADDQAEAPADELADIDEAEPSAAPDAEGGSPASDDPSLREFEELEEFLGIEQRSGTWVLDDGIDEDAVEWDDFDRESAYLPRGLVHFGVGTRIAAMPGGGTGLPAPDGPMVEVSFLADFRYTQRRPWRMRLALAINYQPYDEENVGAGTTIAQSPFAMRLRVMPLSFDIGHWVGVRIGMESGIQWAPGAGPDGGEMTLLLGSTGEIVLNLLDGLLEVGLVGGMQLTAVGRSSRSGYGTDLRPEGIVGATAGYFFE